MPIIKASNINEANELMTSGKYKEIILDFDIAADDFFTLATAQPDIKITIPDGNHRTLAKAE